MEGIATSRPATVVISAADTPGAMAAMVATPCCAIWPKVLITPHTVPSKPRNGAPLTAIASRISPDSSLSDSCATVFSMERFTCSIPLSETNFLRPLPSGFLSRASSSRLPA